jgi:hypothetical protein
MPIKRYRFLVGCIPRNLARITQLLVLVIALHVADVGGECANACNGHGVCTVRN